MSETTDAAARAAAEPASNEVLTVFAESFMGQETVHFQIIRLGEVRCGAIHS